MQGALLKKRLTASFVEHFIASFVEHYRKATKTEYALFFTFMLLILIENSILVFLLVILAYMQGNL